MQQPKNIAPKEGFLRVGDRLIDLGGHRFADAPDQRLTPKAVAVLIALAQAPGRTVSTDELLDRVWAGTCPTVDVVRQVVRELRRAFGEQSSAPRYIETIAKAGYRLIADCEFRDATPSSAMASENVAASAGEPQRPSERDRPPPASSRAVHWLPALSVAVAIVLLFTVLAPARNASPPSPPEAAAMPEVVMITSEPSRDVLPRLSPDGTRVAYAAAPDGVNFQVHVAGIDGSGTLVLSRHDEGSASFPAWSRDGLQIAYYHWTAQRCRIVVVPAMGGIERSYDACTPADPAPLDWFPDNRALLLSQRVDPDSQVNRLFRLDLQTGELAPYGHFDPDNTIDQMPRFSPDGRWLAVRRGSFPTGDLWLLPVSGGEPRRLTSYHANLYGHGWRADGRGLVFSANHTGRFVLHWLDLGSGSVASLGIGDAMFPSMSEEGLLLFQRTRYHVALKELPRDAGEDARPAESIPLPLSTGHEFNPRFSPDGRHLAFLSTRSGHRQLWIHDRQQDAMYQLTRLRGGHIRNPNWDPSGRKLLIPVQEGELSVLYEADVASGTLQVVLHDPRFIESAAYGAGDRRWLALGDGGTITLHAFDAGDASAQPQPLGLAATRLQTQGSDPAVYFREPRSGDLYRYAPGMDRPERLNLPFKAWQWRLDGPAIHALETPDPTRFALWHYDLAEGRAERVQATTAAPGLFLPLVLNADRDPASGRWVAPSAVTAQDDIAAAILPALMQGTDAQALHGALMAVRPSISSKYQRNFRTVQSPSSHPRLPTPATRADDGTSISATAPGRTARTGADAGHAAPDPGQRPGDVGDDAHGILALAGGARRAAPGDR